MDYSYTSVERLLSELSFWKSDWHLKDLLEKQPLSYIICQCLLAKRGVAQADFFLNGYEEPVPIIEKWSYTVDLSEEAVRFRNERRETGSSFIPREKYEMWLQDSKYEERSYLGQTNLPEPTWRLIFRSLSAFLGIDFIVDIYRVLGFLQPDDMLMSLSPAVQKELFGALASSEIKQMLTRSTNYRHLIITTNTSRLKEIFKGELDDPILVEFFRKYLLPYDCKDDTPTLSLREKAYLAGYRHFTIEDNAIVVTREQHMQTLSERVAENVHSSLDGKP